MEKINLQKSKQLLSSKAIYIYFAVAFAIMMLLFPNEGRFKYDYQKGRPWLYETLTAPIDFPLLKTQSELLRERDLAASSIVPYYNYDNSVLPSVLQKLAMGSEECGLSDSVANILSSSLKTIYEKGVLPEKTASEQVQESDAVNFLVIQRNKESQEHSENELYNKDKAFRQIKSDLMAADIPDAEADSILLTAAVPELIVPNLQYDKSITELLHKEAINYISPTKGMIYTGQLIVSNGEVVTAEIEQLLDSYKAEYRNSLGYTGAIWQLLLSHALFVLALLALLFLTIFLIDAHIFKQKNKLSFLLFVNLLTFTVTVIMHNIAAEYMFCIPYSVFALYLLAFTRPRLALPVYSIILLPVLIIEANGLELYFLNLIAGGVAIISFTFFNRGWLHFVSALMSFVAMALLSLAFALLESDTLNGLSNNIILYLFLNALFVVGTYPLVYLIEKIFMLVSLSTLKDLSDTNNPLLQEVARKAPGTFQHSLQVSNLAERAAAAIGANSILVKVGALYHDVGKLVNPQCFIENEAPGIHFHASLSPIESARLIIRHVQDGVEIAKKYHIPQVVIDFITSHHGRSQTIYFYNQYCNNGGDSADIGEFTYNGTLPTTSEQVIVMMADAVEAASRTLKNYSKESIAALVDGILSKRISDSQLIMADISIKDINIVKEIFKKQLGDIYHARIAYPKREEKDALRSVKMEPDME